MISKKEFVDGVLARAKLNRKKRRMRNVKSTIVVPIEIPKIELIEEDFI